MGGYFNPHEREARDLHNYVAADEAKDFNPHEREARDMAWRWFDPAVKQILIHTSVKLVTSNAVNADSISSILIHTSVKLVTRGDYPHARKDLHFNPHEREARDLNSLA